MQLLVETDYIEIEEIIDDIKAMGSGTNPSGHVTQPKEVMLQTLEEILEFSKGKPAEKVGHNESCVVLIVLVVSGMGVYAMWSIY